MFKPVKHFIFLLLFVYFSNPSLAQARYLIESVWEAKAIDQEVLSFDVNDVDGDAVFDCVYITQHSIVVSDFQEQGLKTKVLKKTGHTEEFHRVNLGDWDHDGIVEILVSGFVRQRPVSWLYRVDETKLVLEQEFDGLVLPLQTQNENLLYTQTMRGQWSWSNQAVQLVYNHDKWHKKEKTLKLDFGVGDRAKSLFHFVRDKDHLVYFDSENKINVLDAQGKKIGKSNLSYGSTFDFVTTQEKDALGINQDKIFNIPARMLFRDNTLFVINNESYLRDLVGAVPNIKYSQIMLLKWTEAGYQEEKTTTRFPGIVTDIRIIDYDADQKDEILLTLLIKKTGYFDAYRGHYATVFAVIELPR